MTIQINKTDRNGKQIEIGSMVRLWDWGRNHTYIGEAEVIWDNDGGKVSITPLFIEDSYDLWGKAFPICEVIS